jgi:hypothetical protein
MFCSVMCYGCGLHHVCARALGTVTSAESPRYVSIHKQHGFHAAQEPRAKRVPADIFVLFVRARLWIFVLPSPSSPRAPCGHVAAFVKPPRCELRMFFPRVVGCLRCGGYTPGTAAQVWCKCRTGVEQVVVQMRHPRYVCQVQRIGAVQVGESLGASLKVGSKCWRDKGTGLYGHGQVCRCGPWFEDCTFKRFWFILSANSGGLATIGVVARVRPDSNSDGIETPISKATRSSQRCSRDPGDGRRPPQLLARPGTPRQGRNSHQHDPHDLLSCLMAARGRVTYQWLHT